MTENVDITARVVQCRVYEAQPGLANWPAPPGLEDVWSRIHDLLAHLRAVREDEAAVQAQQRGMIRDGCFLMPSPFAHRVEDLCSRSWFHEYQFYYQFEAAPQESYFWITGLLSRGYSLDTIWFPARRIAVTNFPSGIDCDRLARFEELLTRLPRKPAWNAPQVNVPRVAMVGFQHLMHMLWNELPALDRLVGMALPDIFGIAVQCEPFGPTRELFPELAARVRSVRYEDAPEENANHGLVLGLGSWTITRGTQERIRRLAPNYVSPEVLAVRDRFKADHDPVFWFSVKPPKRTMSDQAEILASLIDALCGDYPNAGFILDGASLPWDFPSNTNYPGWFHSVSDSAVRGSATIIAAILEGLQTALRDHIVSLNGISACEETIWGEAATFYVCHGGTMQHKIGWLHSVPGFIHSNRNFLRLFRQMPAPVIDGPACYYASESLIIDDDPTLYSEHELARKDQNYSFASLSQLLEEIRAAVIASHAAP